MIAVPATPATMIAVTNGANSRMPASTKNPPDAVERAEQRQEVRRLQPRRPEVTATIEIAIGNQQSWRAKMNCESSSPP